MIELHTSQLLYSPSYKNLDVYVYSINDILKIYNRVSLECKKLRTGRKILVMCKYYKMKWFSKPQKNMIVLLILPKSTIQF